MGRGRRVLRRDPHRRDLGRRAEGRGAHGREGLRRRRGPHVRTEGRRGGRRDRLDARERDGAELGRQAADGGHLAARLRDLVEPFDRLDDRALFRLGLGRDRGLAFLRRPIAGLVDHDLVTTALAGRLVDVLRKLRVGDLVDSAAVVADDSHVSPTRGRCSERRLGQRGASRRLEPATGICQGPLSEGVVLGEPPPPVKP